ncbi:uncharacterized protein LOC123440821 isoform X2 [Hordeum vulgare subsp. vulgare]|uniref:Uncharacterized protein n=1 Tax=Hordeum vulgare subsp. vulgare TaxID=112509 RepID=A0A8I6X7Q8_HORVV|nr:uncharacterized protein LOC123440821 isoform X2 [Hordeum vulgare subsp. vulgare]
MVNSSSTQSERTSGLNIPTRKSPPAVIHFEMGEAYDSPTKSSSNTKDEVVHEGMREEEEATCKYSSNNLKKKPTKMNWKEVDVPTWLKEFKSYKNGEWKVLVNKRENGTTDWKYIHQRYQKTFRSAPGVRFFLDGSKMNRVFEGEKLRNKKKNNPHFQETGASKTGRGRKAADTRTRALTHGKPFHYVPENLPVGFI